MALTLTFNLSEVLRREFTVEQRRAVAPAINKPGFKREFGFRAIDAILDRTNAGKDKRDNPFKAYSKAYRQSRNFRLFGKSSRVNLKLSGEMQASIGVIPSQGATVRIAITDAEQEGKARGHINGSNNLPVRDFWGLSISDQGKIMKELLRESNTVENLEAIQEQLDILDSDIQVETVVGDEPVSNVAIPTSVLSVLGDLLGEDNGDV